MRVTVLKVTRMKILSAIIALLVMLSGCEQSDCAKLLNDKNLPPEDRASVEDYCERQRNG